MWLLLAVCSLGLPVSAQAQIDDDGFRAVVAEFGDANFREKESIAERLIDTGHASARAVLTALLEDRFFFRQQDQQPFIVESTDENLSAYALVDPVSLEDAGSAEPDQLSRVITNNRLRRFLRITIARFALSSPDADIRVDAVKQMLRSLDAASIELLRERAAEETDSRVSYEIDTALALAALDEEDESSTRIAAVTTLADRLNPDAYNRLSALLERDEDGSFIEGDEDVRLAAAEAMRRIDTARNFYAVIETAFFGLSLGSVLALAAIGLTITFGVMGVINLAHGELLMLGAYTTYVVQLCMPDHIDVSILVAIPAAFIVAGTAGVPHRANNYQVSLWPTTRDAASNVRGEPGTATARAVRVLGEQSPGGDANMDERYTAVQRSLFAHLQPTLHRLVHTDRVRCFVDGPQAHSSGPGVASSVAESIDGASHGHPERVGQRHDLRIGSGHRRRRRRGTQSAYQRWSDLGQAYIVDSFMVVVFGGVGNIWGTLIGGLSLGIVNKVLEPFAGAVLGKIFVLVALILFIQRRPRGLFPQTGRAAEG